MEHEIVTQPALHLIGFEIRTANDRAHEIGEHWGRFLVGGVPEEIPGRTDDTILAVYAEYEGDHTRPYTYFLGCPVAPGTETPPGMVAREVPAGRYARFVAQGEQPDALIEAWQGIWTAPLRRSFDVDYEVHRPSDPTRVEIHIGFEGTPPAV